MMGVLKRGKVSETWALSLASPLLFSSTRRLFLSEIKLSVISPFFLFYFSNSFFTLFLRSVVKEERWRYHVKGEKVMHVVEYTFPGEAGA